MSVHVSHDDARAHAAAILDSIKKQLRAEDYDGAVEKAVGRVIDEALVDEQDGFMRLRLQALREVFEKDRRRIELEATMGE